ncbi:MAG: phospholipid carrier-dependent glycosyltransferase, partial [Anaerolineae bacterium]
LQVRVCADPTVPVEVCPPEQKRWLSWGEYFDTANSPLNPHNRGYGFFVYGTLPIFLVRYSAELMNDIGVWARHVLDTSSAGGLFARPLSALAAANWADYGHVHLIGRQWSALADLGTILLLYLIAARLYNRKVALLAAAFSTLAVLQIQQSHFFTVDTFANFFIYLATYFAVRVALDPWRAAEGKDAPVLPTRRAYLKSLARDPLLWHSVGFGLALGMAVASKLNAAPLAVLLPAAFLSREAVRAALTGREAESAVSEAWRRAVLYVVTGALVSLIAFRVFQPYAFKGPGFFGLMPNDAWIANIREQRAQASGDVDLPFALQWARRSHLFSFKNLTLWGLGLPLGILAWAGFLGMGWRILKGDRHRHALLWGWTALYFLWQSLQFNPTMRYQLPIYPLLAMMAAWGVFALARWKDGRLKPLAALLGGLVLVLTAAWAFAFTRIYTRPHTRVAASRWIYQNVPGALNLLIRTPEGERYQQPLPFAHGSLIQPGQPFTSDFTIQADGTLEGVSLARPTSRPPGSRGIALSLLAKAPQDGLADTPLAGATYPLAPGARGEAKVPLSAPVALQGQTTYVLSLQVVGEGGQVDLCAPITLPFTVEESEAWDEVVQPPTQCVLGAGGAVQIEFTPQADGTLSEVVFSRLDDVTPPAEAVTLTLSLAKPGSESPLLQVQQRGDFRASETRREPFTLSLPQPLPVRKGEQLRLSLDVDGGSLTLSGSAPINESSWDDGLPLRLDGYDGFGGIYQPGLNLELYWDDNAEKLQRFLDTLNQGDYIFISSNRQWGSIPRVPERYPLTIAYYRALLGCPPEREVVWCYNVARPGDFQGELGYDLVAVFESFPSLHIPGLLDWEVNDQFAEEAFTVYDHPKVLIFKKRPDYDPERVAAILGAVDLSRVVHLTPRRAASYKDLMLPPRLLEIQRAGGTWSELFNRDALHNRYPVLGLLLWYLTVFVLGLAAYPLVRLALPGLADGGYPLARSVGMLLLAYLSWLAGSFGVPYHRVTIGVAFGAILLLGAALAWGRREALRAEWRERRGYVLFIEALFLAFFLLDLAIRLGNPDLWHPAKGGERPMDFSYLNAVLKSTVFPPYDPWYA